MAMKRAEMGTELIDHLTPEEKHLLSRLNPEITGLKENLITCKTDRIEVRRMKYFQCTCRTLHVHLVPHVHIIANDRQKQGKQSLRLI